jgi:hypothetical protein
VTGSVDAYVAHVDRLLAAGQSLFATSTGRANVSGTDQQSIPSPPSKGGLSFGVTGIREDYQQKWHTVTALDADTDGQGSAGRSENKRAGAAATAVRDTARAQADAIAPSARSPAGARVLVSSMDERLTAMQREIDTAKAQQRLLATRLRQLANAYRMMAPQQPVALDTSQIGHSTVSPLARMSAPRALSGSTRSVLEHPNATTQANAPAGGAALLTRSSTAREVAARIIWEAHRRGFSRHQAIAILSTAMQESGLDPKARSPNGLWESIFQQDASYPGRADPNAAISAFFDRLGAKGGPATQDIWKSIFWLQQRPGEPSAEAAYTHGRKGYLVEIQSQLMPATRLYNELTS